MTVKERILYVFLITFTVVSILIGLIPSAGEEMPDLPPMTIYDRLYFLGQQLTELLLLCGIYTVSKHIKLILLLRVLITLSIAELFEDLIDYNVGFHISDYVLMVGVFVIVYNMFKDGLKK